MKEFDHADQHPEFEAELEVRREHFLDVMVGRVTQISELDMPMVVRGPDGYLTHVPQPMSRADVARQAQEFRAGKNVRSDEDDAMLAEVGIRWE